MHVRSMCARNRAWASSLPRPARNQLPWNRVDPSCRPLACGMVERSASRLRLVARRGRRIASLALDPANRCARVANLGGIDAHGLLLFDLGMVSLSARL